MPQLAADAEAAKAKQGRCVLGELERGALGKGKVQAASVRKLRSSMSGAGRVAWRLRYFGVHLQYAAAEALGQPWGPPPPALLGHPATQLGCHVASSLQTLPA